jgi:hypothetical protein
MSPPLLSNSDHDQGSRSVALVPSTPVEQLGEAIAEMVLVCRRHHRLVHEGGYGVERGVDGEVTFVRPDGRPIARSPSLSWGRASHASTHASGGAVAT